MLSAKDAARSGTLEELLDELDSLHYTTLQEMCWSGGAMQGDFVDFSNLLGISPAEWKACYSDSPRCEDEMVSNIRAMFAVAQTKGLERWSL